MEKTITPFSVRGSAGHVMAVKYHMIILIAYRPYCPYLHKLEPAESKLLQYKSLHCLHQRVRSQCHSCRWPWLIHQSPRRMKFGHFPVNSEWDTQHLPKCIIVGIYLIFLPEHIGAVPLHIPLKLAPSPSHVLVSLPLRKKPSMQE